MTEKLTPRNTGKTDTTYDRFKTLFLKPTFFIY